jgi:hypothetical protein
MDFGFPAMGFLDPRTTSNGFVGISSLKGGRRSMR